MTVASEFASFATALKVAPPPEAALHGARRAVLDWFGAAISGSTHPPATLLAERFGGGAGAARLVPTGAPADPRVAALVNGAASHTVEVDDIFREGLYHPGVAVIPAALAAAEEMNASGADFLIGVIAGYEISNRIAAAVNPAHYENWHTTGTVGHFGAAAAAASIYGLEAGRFAHALTTVATFAAGLRHAFAEDAMSKPLHAGRAAEAGLTAAAMAGAGVTGVSDILEAERGFAHALGNGADWSGAMADLGRRWTINEMTVKAHACCGHAFASIDALMEIMAKTGRSADDIAAVEARTYRAGVEICGDWDPASPYQAKFSLPYCLASAVIRGHCAPSAFDPDILDDPKVRALMGRVTLLEEPACQAAFPGRRSAVVAVTFVDGQVAEQERRTRRGDPDDPLSDRELTEKFHTLADPVIGRASAEEVAEAIAALARAPDVSRLFARPRAAE